MRVGLTLPGVSRGPNPSEHLGTLIKRFDIQVAAKAGGTLEHAMCTLPSAPCKGNTRCNVGPSSLFVVFQD